MTHFVLLLLVAVSVSTETTDSTVPVSEVTTENTTIITTETSTSNKEDTPEPFSNVISVGILLSVMIICFLLVFCVECCHFSRRNQHPSRVVHAIKNPAFEFQ